MIRTGLVAVLACMFAAPTVAQAPPKTPDAKPPAEGKTITTPDGRVFGIFTPRKATPITPNAPATNPATNNVTPPAPVTPTIPTVPKQGVVRPNCAS